MNPGSGAYIGRFAPSPTGPLHAGSLLAALASWLDARAHGGRWLVRMEDVDRPRCPPGLDRVILQQLARCGLHSDAPPLYQSQRSSAYQQALQRLTQRGLAYPCACTRSDVEAALIRLGRARPRHGELLYPGTCRNGTGGRPARAWRLRTDVYTSKWLISLMNQGIDAMIYLFSDASPPPTDPCASAGSDAAAGAPPDARPDGLAAPRHAPAAATVVTWQDRRLGAQAQDVGAQVGDFVLKRADGCFAYQLAVVVDDAWQGVTHVVRGEDLADNTPRQILLQRSLGLTTPQYLHTPLVRGADGHKLSKQNGAIAFDASDTPAAALRAAAQALGLSAGASNAADSLARWVAEWAQRHCRPD